MTLSRNIDFRDVSRDNLWVRGHRKRLWVVHPDNHSVCSGLGIVDLGWETLIGGAIATRCLLSRGQSACGVGSAEGSDIGLRG